MKNNPLQILKPFPLTTMQYGKGLLMTLLTAFALFFTGSLHAQSNTNTPISLYGTYLGDYNYQVIGNSELIETSSSNNCGVVGATSKTLTIPAGATIVKAYVHWYAMVRNTTNIGPAYQQLGNISFTAPGAAAVTLDATAIPAFAPFAGGFINVEGKKVDVTAALQALANPNGTYSVDINGGFPNACPLNQANTRAWTLTVVYTTPAGISQKIYLYNGLVGILGNTSITNVSGYAVPTSGSTNGTLTGVFLQGDPGITGESSITSDPSFPNFPSDFGNSSSGAALDIVPLTGPFTANSTNMNITTSTSGDFIVEAEYAIKIPCPAPVITIQPGTTQTVCSPAAATPLSVTATGAGTLTYQWFKNTVNNNTTGTAIPGATSSTYTPPNATNGTIYYYAQVTGACGSPTSSTISVVTVNKTTITAQPSATAQSVCLNAATTALSVTAVGPGLTYQWYSNVANNTTTGTAISGATSSSYTPLSTTAGTLYYYVIVGGTCNSDTSTTSPVTVTICECYNDPKLSPGNELPTKHGITLLKRAGAGDADNWPMVRNGGFTALESNSKGFVITRLTTVEIEGQASPLILPKIANPQEGMMVYDKTVKCLKIYSDGVWSCFNTQTCP